MSASEVLYAGTTHNRIVTLAIPVMIAHTLESVHTEEWEAPAILQLLDSTGAVWHESLLVNPAPRVMGDRYEYDYSVEFVVPEAPPATYTVSLRRCTIQSTFNIDIEGYVSDAHGAKDVLALYDDTAINWYLVDSNPNAVVDYRVNLKRITGEEFTLTGTTTKMIQGNDVVFESETYNPTVDGVPASLDPWSIIWNIKDTPSSPKRSFASRLILVNDSQLAALIDLKGYFDRLHQEARLPSLEFSMSDYANWLRHGRDMFNASGLFSSFTMLDATQGIRHYWMICSIIWALRNRYLLEGLRSFSFSGQSVSLDVDTTQYLEGLASTLSGEWDSAKDSFKTQLKTYGLVGGSGNMNQARLQIGALGINMSPATNMTGYYGARSPHNQYWF